MKFKHLINTLDYHHGQASRTIISGYPPILGSTMKKKAAYYDKHLAWIHRSLIREPRGHANMLGSILTEPVSPEAAIGVLYLHAEGQFEMCGDSAFATAYAVLENGIVEPVEPLTEFAMDTVAGLVRVKAEVRDGSVNQVTIENVPAFYVEDYQTTLSTGTLVTLEIAYGGLYYALVDSNFIGISLKPKNAGRLIKLGMEIIGLANDTLNIRHNYPPYDININLVTFYEKLETQKSNYLVCNIYPPGRMGRTPSGTGLSAHLALRCHKGQLKLHQDFIQKSIVGTTFTGKLTGKSKKEGLVSYIPAISTRSYLMGINQYIIDPDDPFKEGFVLDDN
ncbi:MAG: proline racemase family protein [Desulfobacula sp.]|nr:proline racemase family protein [Desulfobacula sp.]